MLCEFKLITLHNMSQSCKKSSKYILNYVIKDLDKGNVGQEVMDFTQ